MTRPTGGRYLDCIEAERHRREKGESDVNLASEPFYLSSPALNIGAERRGVLRTKEKNRFPV